jgi:uncharacterized protein (DUF1697 family)
MARQVVLLRGINVGSRNRIAMPALREALDEAGFEDVQTYLQSGNVLLSSMAKPESVARKCERQIAAKFGLDIAVVARTRAELAKVVQRNPLGKVAKDPKRYQVSFLSAKLGAEAVLKLDAAAVEPEQFVVIGREVYAWHPETIARSRLWALLAGQGLGVTATSRNWATVTKLLAMAES